MASAAQIREKMQELARKKLQEKEEAAKKAALDNGLIPAKESAPQQTGSPSGTKTEVVVSIPPAPTELVMGDDGSVQDVADVEPVNEQHRAILESLANLKALMIAGDPDFALLLGEIHSQLIQYPELTHILTDDQIDAVYKGLLQKNQVHIAVKVSKAKAPKGGKKSEKGLLPDGSKVGDFL
jgi:hypothetical protein